MDALAKIMDPSVTADIGEDDEIHFSDPIDPISVDADAFGLGWAHHDQTFEEISHWEGTEEYSNNRETFATTKSLSIGDKDRHGDDGEEVVGEWRPLSPGGGEYDDERYDL